MCEVCGCGTRGDVMLYDQILIQFDKDEPVAITSTLARQLASFAYRVQVHHEEYIRNWGDMERLAAEIDRREKERTAHEPFDKGSQ